DVVLRGLQPRRQFHHHRGRSRHPRRATPAAPPGSINFYRLAEADLNGPRAKRIVMSEPVKLQNRLKAEFADEPPRSARARSRRAAARDSGFPDAGKVAPAPRHESHAALRSAVAGLGLFLAVLVLATGMAAGFYIAAASLGLAGIAGAAILFRSCQPAAGIE